MIPSIVKVPVSLAHQIVTGAVGLGVSVASDVLHRVLPGGHGTDHEAPSPDRSEQSTSKAGDDEPKATVTDITPPKPDVSAEPVTQPPAPEQAPTPGATTTLADPAPATATPATRATARQATARKGPAKPSPKKAPATSTNAQKAVAKKTPAKKATPTKPASVLDEPVAPIDDDPIVYSTGPDA